LPLCSCPPRVAGNRQRLTVHQCSTESYFSSSASRSARFPHYTRTIRRDAALQSRAVTVGQVTQEFAPYLPGFAFNPKDARFLGSPVDFVVFDGLDDGGVRQVVFVEVKTGGSELSTRERDVRAAVEAGHVTWKTLRL
jgi:predicted Holliday junction resolvase-like endonuclease